MLLGALALIQTAFLPGFLAIRIFRLKRRSPVETAVLSLALSLLINYVFVFGTTLLHVHTRPVVLGGIGAEVVLGAWLVFRNRRSGRSDDGLRLPRIRPRGWLQLAVLVLSVGTVALFVVFGIITALRFRVFAAWDPLFQWNVWAYRWYQGAFPSDSGMYPQLVPANWSMMYTILGTPEMQSFPLALMPIFPVATLGILFDVGLQKKRLEYLLAVVVCGAAFVALRAQMPLASGYIDPPLVFMVLAALYVIELRDTPLLGDWRELALPALLAAAASVTKFNGSFVLLIVAGLGVAGHWASRANLTTRDWMRSALVTVGVLSIPGAWYGVKVIDFLRGHDVPNTAELVRVSTVATGSTSVVGRFLGGVPLLPGGWATVGVFVLIALLSVRSARSRWISIAVLAYTALWAVFLSYDFRNEFLVVPFIAYVTALSLATLLHDRFGTERDLEVAWNRHPGPRLSQWVVAGVVLVVGLLAVSAAVPDQRLLAHELSAQRVVGVPELNRQLYDVVSRTGELRGTILTDYAYLQVLPGFRSDSIRTQRNQALKIHYLTREELRPQDLEGPDYLLLSDVVSADVRSAVQSKIADGSYSVLFTTDTGTPGQAFAESGTVRLLRAKGVGETDRGDDQRDRNGREVVPVYR